MNNFKNAHNYIKNIVIIQAPPLLVPLKTGQITAFKGLTLPSISWYVLVH